MPDEKQSPSQQTKQRTAKDLEIPVPKRGEVDDALKKLAPPVKPKR